MTKEKPKGKPDLMDLLIKAYHYNNKPGSPLRELADALRGRMKE